MPRHFGCIFIAISKFAIWVYCALYIIMMGTQQTPTRHYHIALSLVACYLDPGCDPWSTTCTYTVVMAMAMRRFMFYAWLGYVKHAIHAPDLAADWHNIAQVANCSIARQVGHRVGRYSELPTVLMSNTRPHCNYGNYDTVIFLHSWVLTLL